MLSCCGLRRLWCLAVDIGRTREDNRNNGDSNSKKNIDMSIMSIEVIVMTMARIVLGIETLCEQNYCCTKKHT